MTSFAYSQDSIDPSPHILLFISSVPHVHMLRRLKQRGPEVLNDEGNLGLSSPHSFSGFGVWATLYTQKLLLAWETIGTPGIEPSSVLNQACARQTRIVATSLQSKHLFSYAEVGNSNVRHSGGAMCSVGSSVLHCLPGTSGIGPSRGPLEIWAGVLPSVLGHTLGSTQVDTLIISAAP